MLVSQWLKVQNIKVSLQFLTVNWKVDIFFCFSKVVTCEGLTVSDNVDMQFTKEPCLDSNECKESSSENWRRISIPILDISFNFKLFNIWIRGLMRGRHKREKERRWMGVYNKVLIFFVFLHLYIICTNVFFLFSRKIHTSNITKFLNSLGI